MFYFCKLETLITYIDLCNYFIQNKRNIIEAYTTFHSLVSKEHSSSLLTELVSVDEISQVIDGIFDQEKKPIIPPFISPLLREEAQQKFNK